MSATAIRQHVLAHLRKHGIPGAAVAVVAGGKPVITEGVGVTAPRGTHPVTANTLFQAGSVSKSVTATAVLQLQQRGLVDLDAPVQRYLPWFRVADAALSPRITVRHLLSQTSGLPMGAWKVGHASPAVQESEEAALRAAATVPLQGVPGAKWAYSNMNYMALGALVAAVTGQPFRTHMQEELFGPLGMHGATFDGKTARTRGAADPVQPRLGRQVVLPHETPGWGDACGLNLYLNARDLSAYLRHLLANSPAMAAAWAPQSETGMPGLSYAMGWWVAKFAGRRMLFCPGQPMGGDAVVALLPEENLGVAIALGKYGMSAGRLAEAIFAVLLDIAPPAKPVTPDLTASTNAMAYTVHGVGVAMLVGLSLLGGRELHPVVTAIAAALVLLLLALPGLMKRNPALPLPVPANAGPGGWPTELIAAWVALLTGTGAWMVYGLL
jgi:CubicO group peptidase (beta-lactamase class C family)